MHSFKDGQARFTAYLDDYACLLDGLAEVYQATFETRYLESALELGEQMIDRFADAEGGGFYYTASDHEQLIVRQKDSQDNATPSGNAMAATALLKLGRLTGRRELEDRAVKTLESLSGQMKNLPSASGQALIALEFLLGNPAGSGDRRWRERRRVGRDAGGTLSPLPAEQSRPSPTA